MPELNSLIEEIRDRLEMMDDAKINTRFMLANGLLELYGFPRTLEFLCEDPSIGELDDGIEKTGGYDALKEWRKEYSTSELIEPLLFLIDGTNRLEDADAYPEYKIVKLNADDVRN